MSLVGLLLFFHLMFLVQREETHRVKEALKILKKWNPRWAPTYEMTDYSDKLIGALQGTFPQANHLLCAFHREMAWDRWLRKGMFFFHDHKVCLFIGLV